MAEPARLAEERQRMVKEQIAGRGIRHAGVLRAMAAVPRHRFVPESVRNLAYGDGPLPIGDGQTISQPYIVGLMTELLALTGAEKVLEVGCGSGYQAAVLAHLARQVFSLEQHAGLAETARQTLADLELANVTVLVGDGSQGLPDEAPFDAVIVTAAAPAAPQPLLDQLADGGRLVLPVGGWRGQILELWLRTGTTFEQHSLVPVAFVPLRGKFGWRPADWPNG